MSYPTELDTAKEIQNLLFRKEFAQLHLNKDHLKKIKTKENQTLNDVLSAPDLTNLLSKINELTLDPQILKENLLVLHSHQLFVRNLINPDTPYWRLLLKHATGTGKTIAALAIAMLFIKYYQLQHSLTEESGYSHTPLVYIIGFSKSIFQKELLRRPEFGFITKEEIAEHKRLRYLASVGSQNDKDIFAEFEARIKKRLSKKSRGGFFKFYGYKEFFNRLFIFSEEYLKEQTTPESVPVDEEESESVSILTEDQIINGLKSGSVTLNFELIDSFANSLIICDEIHNVYNSSEINNYGIALRMLLNIFDMPDVINKYTSEGLLKGTTIQGLDRLKMLKNTSLRALFMSATPINNSPTEIVDLLNLLIPLSRLPKQKKLEKDDFFEDNRNLKKGALQEMQNLIQGYVSFLRDDNPKYFPERKFKGEDVYISKELLKDRVSFYKGTTIPYLKFVKCPMSDYHQKTYDAIYTGTLPPDGQSLMDIVLPNPGLLDNAELDKSLGLFRTKDIKYSLVNSTQAWRDKNQISLEKIPDTNTYVITGEFMKYKNLKKYSTKYVKMLDSVFDNLQNDKGKIIISHQYVKMSGVLFIQEVLRRNGIIDEYASPTDDTLCSKCGYTKIQHAKGSKNHEFISARFIVYHGDIDKPTLDKSLEKFKSPENIDGYQYRIFIGSKIINEGIDFNAVQNLWVMVAPANIPTLLQIFGRAIRKNSHLGLPVEKQKVRIKIFVSSMSGRKMSYEEKKYFEKSQDYLVIQQIEKVFNENAIDAVIHRDIIMPHANLKNEQPELGALYFEPSGIFGKKWIDVSKGSAALSPKDVTLSTFRLYHSDEEISTMIYVIKRLFIEQSTVWAYDDLWEMVKNPPFEIYVEPNLFLEENFRIALHVLSEFSTSVIDTYQITNDRSTYYDISRLFDHLDKRIIINDKECKILFINGFYMLFPIMNVINQDLADATEFETSASTGKMPPSYLGISSLNLSGIPDIDIDNWNRQFEDIENTALRITKYLKTSNISYNQMKFKFYLQFRDVPIEEMPTSVEVYDLDFHSRLVEDSIRYAFNILTNPSMPFSELHDFYFKMLYFYDRLDLVLFADHLEDTKLIDHYKAYTTHVNLKFDVYDVKRGSTSKKIKKAKENLAEQHKYNPFLMSSILKASEENRTFNINRLNDFLGKRDLQKPDSQKKKHPKLDDMNVSKQIGAPRKTIRKVFSNMLPVGHFLNTSMESSGILAVPKIYIPDLDPDVIISSKKPADKQKTHPWVRAYEFVQYYDPINCVENDLIVGYYEKNPTGIDIKFKLRLPVQKIILHEDSRMIERGSACATRKKEDLIKIAQDLKIDVDEIIKEDSSIKSICNEIKLELMHREMQERRKVKHMSEKEKKTYQRVRFFYLHYEKQLE